MSDELVKKALARYVESYPAAEGRTYEQIVIVTDTAKVIRDDIDRPKEEKDALMAAALLIASREVDIERKSPPDLDSYGEQVKTIVNDYLKGEQKEFTASADLKQIGLANAVILLPVMAATMKELFKNLEKFRGKPQVDQAVADMKDMLDKSKNELEALMTGEQPRLEAHAKQAYADLVDTAREAVRAYETPAPTQQQPAPKKKRRFGFG